MTTRSSGPRRPSRDGDGLRNARVSTTASAIRHPDFGSPICDPSADGTAEQANQYFINHERSEKVRVLGLAIRSSKRVTASAIVAQCPTKRPRSDGLSALRIDTGSKLHNPRRVEGPA